jgi:hypothetical protein
MIDQVSLWQRCAVWLLHERFVERGFLLELCQLTNDASVAVMVEVLSKVLGGLGSFSIAKRTIVKDTQIRWPMTTSTRRQISVQKTSRPCTPTLTSLMQGGGQASLIQ